MPEISHPQGLKIGVISYDFDPPIGGLGVLAKTYVWSLRRLFPDSTYKVISPSSKSDERGPWLGHFRWKKPGGCPLFSLVLSASIGSIVRRHKFDVLHVHSGSGGVFLLRGPPCRTVVTAHHTYRQEADMVFTGQPLKRLWKIFMSVLEKRTYNLADLVTCVSGDTAEAIHLQYGIPKEKLVVIENPIPAEKIEQYASGERKNDTILFVGRLEKRKGILTLLEAFRLLSKEFPDYKLRLVGQNLIGDQLQNFVGSHQLESKVVSLGYIDNPLRLRETALASVLVVPSTLEGFGLVAAEGMILSTCVIASDAPGLKSIVENNRTGLVFKSGDAADLARCLKNAMADANLRRTLGDQARTEAKKRFDADSRAKDLQGAFVSVSQK